MDDRPWIYRTYAGYGTPRATNERFRANLAKGQTGLSVAFDLPTQCGYDPDHPLSEGEVGRVGVPISHLGDARDLFDGIPLGEMNTSMTINATAVWLLSLYAALADERGVERGDLLGTTQNDILKEYLSRGTFVYPPEPSMRLTVDLIVWTLRESPGWNPINVCSYHLQEAGADPVLEVAYTLANAIAVLDATRDSGRVEASEFPRVVGRMSFFCNAGLRFVEEMCKMRAFARLWDRIASERYGVDDPQLRRFRYGVQVNSLGLTAAQPENNAYRILLEMLAVTLSRDARARAIQLPAWNEALGLPREWDQQWSLRAQQILAEETDLLEFEDLFEGSRVVEERTAAIEEEARSELDRVLERGGSLHALTYMKQRLVASLAERLRAVESGSATVVGVNRYVEGEPSPLVGTVGGGAPSFHEVDPSLEKEQLEGLERWREARDEAAVGKALDGMRRAAEGDEDLMPASIEAARAGASTGEWADALREVFGEFRAPTGVAAPVAALARGPAAAAVRARVARAATALGVPRLRMLVAKPGLDGHSNAAEQVAVRARDAGFEVVYQGIRQTPEQIARAAVEEDVHAVGVSVLSGAHNRLIPRLLALLRGEGVDPARIPVVVGGIIPAADAERLMGKGVARVFTPLDHDLTAQVGEIADLIASRA